MGKDFLQVSLSSITLHKDYILGDVDAIDLVGISKWVEEDHLHSSVVSVLDERHSCVS